MSLLLLAQSFWGSDVPEPLHRLPRPERKKITKKFAERICHGKASRTGEGKKKTTPNPPPIPPKKYPKPKIPEASCLN